MIKPAKADFFEPFAIKLNCGELKHNPGEHGTLISIWHNTGHESIWVTEEPNELAALRTMINDISIWLDYKQGFLEPESDEVPLGVGARR